MSRVFVYGTLRAGASRDIVKFYKGVAFAGSGWVHGELFSFGDYPGVRLGGPECGRVAGEVYDVTDEALAGLDAWEGIAPGAVEGGGYRRLVADVTLDAGGTTRAWIYESQAAAVRDLPRIASGDWLRP